MEHEHGAFKVNREMRRWLVKKGPENAPFAGQLGPAHVLQRKNLLP
jgi:hypothetical protein